MELYKGFLMDELDADVERASEALSKIGETPFRDDEVREKVNSYDRR